MLVSLWIKGVGGALETAFPCNCSNSAASHPPCFSNIPLLFHLPSFTAPELFLPTSTQEKFSSLANLAPPPYPFILLRTWMLQGGGVHHRTSFISSVKVFSAFKVLWFLIREGQKRKKGLNLKSKKKGGRSSNGLRLPRTLIKHI